METLKTRRVEKFEIVLEHDIDEQYQYVPGEMMKGVIVITCNDEIKLNQLTVTLQGEGNVVWDNNTNKASKCKSKEIYLDYTENLIRDEERGNTLQAGTHEYVFFHQLSETLPSSYIGKFGSVTYLIKAQLRPDRKYGADAMITNEPFLVLRTYDLSLEPNKLQPYETQDTKTVGTACLCGGKIKTFLKLNRTGFVPGEDIRLNADVANGSRSEVTSLQAALVMTSKFHANKQTVTNDQVISKHDDQYAIEQGEGRRWNDVRLTIPPYIPETALEGCDIIDINYALIFQVILDYNSKPNQNARVIIPITIGTHGVKVDDNVTEYPDLRPLYNKAHEAEPRNVFQNSPMEDDEIGEIDHSLFETEPTAKPRFYAKKTETDHVAIELKEKKANPTKFLYGDIIPASDLPDNQLEGTIRDPRLKKASTKKKKAPTVPEDNNTLSVAPPTEDTTRL